ncbi:MAG: DUF362 domain-containing protein [Nitrospinota bacterium]
MRRLAVKHHMERFKSLFDDERAGPFLAMTKDEGPFAEARAPRLEGPRYRSGGKSLVALVRGASRAEAIEEGLRALGGLGKAFEGRRGGKVLLKPNFNSSDPFPASTHPEHIDAAIRELKALGITEIALGELGGVLSLPTRGLMGRLGMEAFCEERGIELIYFDEAPWARFRVPLAENWGGELIALELLKEGWDVVSLPVLKSHGNGGRFSLSLKNTYGFIHPRDRIRAHFDPRMEAMLAEPNLLYEPAFIILDATKCFISGGPYVGEVREPRCMILGDDRVAVDAVGVALLRVIGSELSQERAPWEHGQIRRAAELGLGARGPEELELITLDTTRSPDFKGMVKALRAELKASGGPSPLR